MVVLLLAGLGLLAFPGVRVLLGLAPRRVALVYVREENSLGLLALPAPGAEATPGFAAGTGVVTLPAGAGRVPRGTRMIVVRETYVAGVLMESRVVCLDRFPGFVAGRSPDEATLAGVDPSCTLLAADLVLEPAGPSAGGEAGVRVEAPGLAFPGPAGATGPGNPVPGTTLEPGGEWRLGAVLEGGVVNVLSPDSPDYAARLRQAFYENRPVSVLSVTSYGLWDIGRIQVGPAEPPG